MGKGRKCRENVAQCCACSCVTWRNYNDIGADYDFLIYFANVFSSFIGITWDQLFWPFLSVRHRAWFSSELWSQHVAIQWTLRVMSCVTKTKREFVCHQVRFDPEYWNLSVSSQCNRQNLGNYGVQYEFSEWNSTTHSSYARKRSCEVRKRIWRC